MKDPGPCFWLIMPELLLEFYTGARQGVVYLGPGGFPLAPLSERNHSTGDGQQRSTA
jgi:hypothetical protein